MGMAWGRTHRPWAKAAWCHRTPDSPPSVESKPRLPSPLLAAVTAPSEVTRPLLFSVAVRGDRIRFPLMIGVAAMAKERGLSRGRAVAGSARCGSHGSASCARRGAKENKGGWGGPMNDGIEGEDDEENGDGHARSQGRSGGRGTGGFVLCSVQVGSGVEPVTKANRDCREGRACWSRPKEEE